MIKILTKRDEREEEALREEGRREEQKRAITFSTERIFKREHVKTIDTLPVIATDLRVGDYFYENCGLRGGERGAEVTFVGDHHPRNREEKTPEGTLWVEYKGDPERGVHNSGGSRIDADDVILIVRRDLPVREPRNVG